MRSIAIAEYDNLTLGVAVNWVDWSTCSACSRVTARVCNKPPKETAQVAQFVFVISLYSLVLSDLNADSYCILYVSYHTKRPFLCNY